MNPSLSLLVLRADKPGKLAEFYAHLGMQFVKHRHGSGPEHLSSEIGSFVFEIYPLKSGDMPTTTTRLGFTVDSVEKAFTTLVQAGAKTVVEPKVSEWGLRAVIDDPEGHRCELTERKFNGCISSALHDS